MMNFSTQKGSELKQITPKGLQEIIKKDDAFNGMRQKL